MLGLEQAQVAPSFVSCVDVFLQSGQVNPIDGSTPLLRQICISLLEQLELLLFFETLGLLASYLVDELLRIDLVLPVALVVLLIRFVPYPLVF